MSMRSACEVRIEILVKEKEVLMSEIECLKDMVAKQQDDL